MAARPLKPLSALSRGSQARIRGFAKAHGYSTQQVSRSRELRRAAVGHAGTPRAPIDALRHPDVWTTYAGRHQAALAELATTDRGRKAALDAAARQASTRGPISAVDPRIVTPTTTWEVRRHFSTLDDARSYANVPYGPHLPIWTEADGTFTVLAQKTTT